MHADHAVEESTSLAERLRDGDATAVAEFYAAHGARVESYCAEVLTDPAAGARKVWIRWDELRRERHADAPPESVLLLATREKVPPLVCVRPSTSGVRGVLHRARDGNPCTETPELLAARANDELDAVRMHDLYSHLRACAQCQDLETRFARAERFFQDPPEERKAALAEALARAEREAAKPAAANDDGQGEPEAQPEEAERPKDPRPPVEASSLEPGPPLEPTASGPEAPLQSPSSPWGIRSHPDPHDALPEGVPSESVTTANPDEEQAGAITSPAPEPSDTLPSATHASPREHSGSPSALNDDVTQRWLPRPPAQAEPHASTAVSASAAAEDSADIVLRPERPSRFHLPFTESDGMRPWLLGLALVIAALIGAGVALAVGGSSTKSHRAAAVQPVTKTVSKTTTKTVHVQPPRPKSTPGGRGSGRAGAGTSSTSSTTSHTTP